jgi:hypothetical protein
MITRSEKNLENYHYSLAKARLQKKLLIHEAAKKGGKGSESPIVKEALWNSRWGVGLRSNIPRQRPDLGKSSTVKVKSNGMHECMIRTDAENFDSEELTHKGVKKVGEEKIKVLRSQYNQVAHQLGIHSIDSVENCVGSERVKKKIT